MLSTKNRIAAGLSLAFAGALVFSACSMGETAADTAPATDESATDESETMAPEEETEEMTDAASNLVGPGCAAYAEMVPSGAGSVQGMSQDPVAVAASNNPLLTTLVAAVSGQLNPEVDLVDTLNGSEFTVFAPVDDAFGKIDAATIEGLKTDTATLSSILTYHVIPGQIEPGDIVGTHETVQGATLEVTGSGDDLMVGGATVICGGVQTANAVVYLVDTVLMPPAS